MDIPREQKPNRRRFIYIGAAILGVVLTTVGLARLKPAAPSVDGGTLWYDTLRMGPMVREVRGPGTLVPEQIRWVVAVAPGRVDRKLVQPGARVVSADSPSSVKAEIEVKMGSMGMKFSGPVTIESTDAGSKTVKIKANTREAGGQSNAAGDVTISVGSGSGKVDAVANVSGKADLQPADAGKA